MVDSTNSNIQETERAKVWLEPTQIDTMRNSCYHDTFASILQARNDAIVTVLADTGLRVGELVQLDVSMLRDNSTKLFIPSHIQKDYPTADSPPAVTMKLSSDTTRTVNSFLSSRWKDTPALFPSRKSDRLTTQGVRYIINDVAEVGSVQPWLIDGSRGKPGDVSPHALRHSVAYRMLHVEDGNTLYDVRNRLRHSSLLTTERVYDHFRTV